ncbi:MAG: hypothetical protein ACTSRP_02100 [Candidatus Helarchaeota archaeon]
MMQHSGENLGKRIKLNDILHYFESFIVKDPFVYLTGGIVYDKEGTTGDIDFLIRSESLPEDLDIPIKFRILRNMPKELALRAHFIYDRFHGPFTSYYPLYRLKLERIDDSKIIELSYNSTDGLDLSNLSKEELLFLEELIKRELKLRNYDSVFDEEEIEGGF